MKKSQFGNFQFNEFDENQILSYTSIREGEVKLGQKVSNRPNSLSKFVVIGICEDVGPQANGGLEGAKNAFESFIPKFLSIQSNSFLDGSEIVLPGYISCVGQNLENFNTVPNIINELDEFVEFVLSSFVAQNLIPIVIGGGHNNAYPIIKTISKFKKTAINVVNCDPHADFRARDYRHSGNPFSFAFYEGYLQKYGIIGLHQSYNNQFILDELRKNNFVYTFYDESIAQNRSIVEDFKLIDDYFSDLYFGIELDMDAIEYMPSSASSPSGISLSEARKYILHFSRSKNVCYLHLPEAAPKNKEEFAYVGKSLTYLVSDFIKNSLKD